MSNTPPADDVREVLAKAWAAHRPTARNGWSGCTCGEENPGLTVNLGRWHESHLLSSMVTGFEVCPRGTVTDAEGSDEMGRFAFDGAEGIAFHIYEHDSDDPDCLTEVMFDELPLLVRFLRHNFPGMFS